MMTDLFSEQPICETCGETIGGSHYHCANCGEKSSMMGHWVELTRFNRSTLLMAERLGVDLPFRGFTCKQKE
jgi:predicted amidophosphoribosyltransferase